MADKNYGTLVTDIGHEKIAEALQSGTTVNWNQIAVGDGNGSYYKPSVEQKELVNECWRGSLLDKNILGDNNNQVEFHGVIPSDVGGFYIREIGIFDDEDNLVVIGNYPEIEKVSAVQGVTLDMDIYLRVIVSNADTIEITVDPNVVLATKRELNELKERVAGLAKPITLSRIDEILQITTGVTPVTVAERISDSVMDKILDDNPENDPVYASDVIEDYYDHYDAVRENTMGDILDNDPSNDPEYYKE